MTQRESTAQRSVHFLVRHRVGVAWLVLLTLLVIVVLQNVEPTQIDLLFWSLPAVPKLVLILVSMAIGALGWELARRLWRRTK